MIIQALLKMFQSSDGLQNKRSDKIYIITYTCNELEKFSFSVIDICCAGGLEFMVLSPVLQKFRLYFFIMVFKLKSKEFKV